MSGSKSSRNFVAPHIAGLPKSGIRDFFNLVAERPDVISLGIGEPDFQTPWHIRERAIEAIERGQTRYTANLGTIALRKAIAGYTRERFGCAYDWQTETLVTVGVSEGLDTALRAILSPGDEVLYHEPCFVAYAPIVQMAHAVPVPVATRARDGFRPRLEDLEAAVTPRTRALLINFPNNPTGAALTEADTRMIAGFAARHDLLVISDEVYSELTYDIPRVSIAALPGMKERTLFLNGFSKAWSMTGFRLGYACAPAAIIDAMMKIHQYTMMCASSISQAAGVEAVKNSLSDIDEMRVSYALRRNFITSRFNEIGLDCLLPEGAFYVFPSIQRTGLSSMEFCVKLLEQESIACVPGSAFGACGEGFIRACYATGMDDVKEAMNRIGAFVKRVT